MLTAIREKEHRAQKFAAALKNIDLDEGEDSTEERFAAVKRRAEAKLAGKTEERYELEGLGFDVVEEGV